MQDAPAEPAESAEVPAMEPAGRAASGAGQGKPGLKRLRKGPAKEVRCGVGCLLVANRMLCQAEVQSTCNMRRVVPASCPMLQ